MLTAHTANGKAFWIDLLNPTSDEIAQVSAEYGIEVPSRESLQEIETSSRLRSDGQVLYASMPLGIQDQAAGFAPLPLGFVLSPQFLVTIRFSEIHAFALVEEPAHRLRCRFPHADRSYGGCRSRQARAAQR
jgi:magnesium transporter